MPQLYISVGSNIERSKMFRLALQALEQHFSDLVLSDVFESEAVGFNGDAFYNMVIAAKTEQSVDEVVSLLKKIEDDNGRIRKCERFSARTLDLDLLCYDALICQKPTELPRDEITKNAFVLWPLSQIAADECHPILNQSYQTLWQDYDKTQQRLWIIDFNWQAS